MIVTKHQKERAILPLLFDRLGLECELLMIDTDVFGTFTGETKRCGTQLDAVIGEATENLIDRLLSACPACASPGVWITEAIRSGRC